MLVYHYLYVTDPRKNHITSVFTFMLPNAKLHMKTHLILRNRGATPPDSAAVAPASCRTTPSYEYNSTPF